jgi:ABC-type amino acid transport substrate-binding protein
MRVLGALVLCLCSLAWSAQAKELVLIAPTNLTDPIAQFERGQLQGGVLKDLGDSLASRMGLSARHLSVPSKRVSAALAEGEADMVCYVLPGWLEGDFLWTVPVFPNAEVLAMRRDAAPVRSLAELQGRRVGTVLGYGYSHLRKQAGEPLPFERFDAPDTRSNLAKLAAGRMSYAMVEELTLQRYLQRHPDAPIRVGLVISRYTAQCALSRHSSLKLEALNRALTQIAREGEMARILARYGG